MDKWGSIKRRHVALKANPVETLQNQFSGYGSTPQTVARTLTRLGIKEPLYVYFGAFLSPFVRSPEFQVMFLEQMTKNKLPRY